MNDKYYHPEIKEFYLGFEYEINYSYLTQNCIPPYKSEWKKETVETVYDIHKVVDLRNSPIIRVKYLDKSDIESLGFKHIGGKMVKDLLQEYELKCEKGYYVYLTYSKFTDHVVVTVKVSVEQGSEKTIVVHSIVINNINELRTLLKQLNIIK